MTANIRGGDRRGRPEGDLSGRFMSEGRESLDRYDDNDDDRYCRRSMSRGRNDDVDYRYRSSEGRSRGARRVVWRFGRPFRGVAAVRTTRATERAAGMAIGKATPRLPAADGTIPTMARAVGTATRKVTPRLLGAAGRTFFIFSLS
jgi:hypothetical protein